MLSHDSEEEIFVLGQRRGHRRGGYIGWDARELERILETYHLGRVLRRGERFSKPVPLGTCFSCICLLGGEWLRAEEEGVVCAGSYLQYMQ